MMKLIILGVLVFLVHAGICGLLISAIASHIRRDNIGLWGKAGAVFVGTSLISSAVLDAVGIYKLITL